MTFPLVFFIFLVFRTVWRVITFQISQFLFLLSWLIIALVLIIGRQSEILSFDSIERVLHTLSSFHPIFAQFALKLLTIQNLRRLFDNRKMWSKQRMLSNIEKGYSLILINVQHLAKQIFQLRRTVLFQLLFRMFNKLFVAKVTSHLYQLFVFSLRCQKSVDF